MLTIFVSYLLFFLEAHAYFVEYIAKAYQALTDPVSRENFEKYGHPDGRQASTRHLVEKGFQLICDFSPIDAMNLYKLNHVLQLNVIFCPNRGFKWA